MDPDEKAKEIHILSTLPVILKWIDADKDLTDDDFRNLKKMYPEQFKFSEKLTFEELIQLNSNYRGSKVYGKYVESLLSEKGLSWLHKTYMKFREFNRKHPD